MSLFSLEHWRSDFILDGMEGTIDKPADGLNGDCVIHFNAKFEGCTMRVKLVDGKREGEAIVLKEGTIQMKLNYRDGKPNGKVEVMDNSGGVQLRGRLLNGRLHGLIKEYSNSLLIWAGYYRDGEIYSVLRRSTHFDGYYEERSVDDGKLLSIAEYDDELEDKNGYCIESEGGALEDWIYEGGEKRDPIQEMDELEIPKKMGRKNGEKRDRPTDQDENTAKRIRLAGLVHELNENSLMVLNVATQTHYGNVRLKEKCYMMRQSMFESQLVGADLCNHAILVYTNNEWRENHHEKGCIDLDVNGRRWEGGVKNGKPFGYGVLFDEEGKKEYEGFMMNRLKVFCGKEYYPSIERVEYDGCYYEGKRFGKGILYDRKGGIECDGLWENGVPSSLDSCNTTVNNHSQCLRIHDEERTRYLSFSLPPWLYSLKQIVIGSNCYYAVYSFELEGLMELESITVGENSFEGKESPYSECDNAPTKTTCRIVNCPRLKSIRFGAYAFSNYYSLLLNKLPSLQSIEMEYHCFLHSSLVLVGTIDELTRIHRSSATSIHTTR